MHTLDTQSDALSAIYARSLFELAEEQGGRATIEELAREFEDIMEITRRDERFVEFLRSAILPAPKRRVSLERIFKGRVSDLMLRFLLVLNDKERLSRIGSIATAFDERLQEKFGRVEVDVYTATPVEAALLSAIKTRLQQAINREPVLHPYTDPTMIGGLKLQIGDQLIDASVATRLRRMQEHIAARGAGAIRSAAERFLS